MTRRKATPKKAVPKRARRKNKTPSTGAVCVERLRNLFEVVAQRVAKDPTESHVRALLAIEQRLREREGDDAKPTKSGAGGRKSLRGLRIVKR